MVHVQLLGPLRVLDEAGLDLTPVGARELACLAALAVVAPTSLSTDRLAAELYRERSNSDPRNAVQAVVSRLRRSLGREAGSIETTTTGYRLVDVEIDLYQAERLLAEAVTSPDLARSETLLARAAELWRGPTLDGLDGGALLEAERVRVDGLRADAEEAVAERRLTAGGGPQLVVGLEAAVRAQPLREKRWQMLMLALYRDGRQADALRAFQRARRILSEQLGLQPGPALADLERRILAQDPELVAAGADQGHASTAAAPSGDPALPRGTVTILLCDVEGSVRQWEAAPERTAADIARLHQIWGEAVALAGGTVVNSTGDGIMAAFPTASAAVEAALGAVAEQRATSDLGVRVALNTGALEPIDDDYRGTVVNRCARLLEIGHGGQILAGGTTAQLAAADLPDGVNLRDLGPQWLRDVAEPVAVWQVDGPGVPSVFPVLRTKGPSSLPRLRGELLGRSELVDEVVSEVSEAGLVTLLGPGGIGKTSAALAVAWRLVATRPVTFVDLAGVADPGSVAGRIADAVSPGEHQDGRTPIERVTDRLRMGTDLVVVDNAEHLLDAVAAVIDEALAHELKGCFLVTSRRPLGLTGELIVTIPPLDLPGGDDDLDATGRSPSVRLFLDRASVGRPGFTLPAGLLPVVAHICRRLDGMPLAIELAAGRTSLLSVDDIAARLDDQLRLLRQLHSTRDRRHRSLEAVVGWSADQLSPPARELFTRLSIMAGAFGLAAVEAVVDRGGLDEVDPLDHLDELQGASLLVVEAGGSRFRMLEPIRQVAAAELAARGLGAETRRYSVAWLTDLVADAHQRRDESRNDAMARVDDEADQLAAALTWIADTGQVELGVELAYHGAYWFLTRRARSGGRLLGRLVSLVDRDRDPMAWATVVMAASVATASHPTSELADDAIDALAIFDPDEQHVDAAVLRVAVGVAQVGGPRPDRALQLARDAERLRPEDDPWAAAVVDMALIAVANLVGDTDLDGSDTDLAIARGLRAAEVFRRFGDHWALGMTVSELGRIHQARGDTAAAEAHYLESLALFGESDYHGCHYILTELGRLASQRDDHVAADHYHARALEIARQDGNRGCEAMAIAGMADAGERRGDVDLAADLYRRAIAMAAGMEVKMGGSGDWVSALRRLEAAEAP